MNLNPVSLEVCMCCDEAKEVSRRGFGKVVLAGVPMMAVAASGATRVFAEQESFHGVPDETRREERAYGADASKYERAAINALVVSFLQDLDPHTQAASRHIFRKGQEKRREAGLIGGKDDARVDLGSNLWVNSSGTVIWGGPNGSQTEITAENINIVPVAALLAAAAYMTYLAWEGCGWAAAAFVAQMAAGDFSNVSTFGSCMWLGYAGGGGGEECEQCY